VKQGANREGSHTESKGRIVPPVKQSHRETKRFDNYGVQVNTARNINEPNTVEKAMSCSKRKNWRDAMEAKFQSLCANQV